MKNSFSRQVDLNADLGEGFPNDRALLNLVSSASVCCGAHAGDPAAILATLREVKAQNVVLGAHPGFADRAHFGRRDQTISAPEVECLILAQVDALKAMAASLGLIVRYVKPHGSLYNQAQREPDVADGVLAAVSQLELPVLGQPGSVLETRAHERGVTFVSEGFPDRRYGADGRLVARSEPNAVLDDPHEIEAQVLRLVDAGVGSLCIHGDDPRAIENASAVRTLLAEHAIDLKGFA